MIKFFSLLKVSKVEWCSTTHKTNQSNTMFEARLMLKYETINARQGKNVYTAAESLLEGKGSATGPPHSLISCKRTKPSRIRVDSLMANNNPIVLRGESRIETTFYTIKPGETLTLPFCLRFPEDMHDLPATFTGQFGTLTYAVAVYLNSSGCSPLAVKKFSKFGGFKNLREESVLLPALSHSSGYKKSFLSKDNSLAAVLTVENGEAGGFLPGEEVTFTVTVDNPKAFMVMGITIALIRKSKYKFSYGGYLLKEQGERLTSLAIHKDGARTIKLLIPGRIGIPKNSGVSYSRNGHYNVSFHLQYEVKVAEFGKPLGGFVDILIGSERHGETRGTFSEEELIPIESEASSSVVSSQFMTSNRLRRRSLNLNEQNDPAQPLLLPSYSQLFPRSSSLETLPPHYDDLVQ